MRKIFLPLIAIVTLTSMFSCKRSSIDTAGIETGYDFFPLEIGKYIVYNVDSTYWDDFTGTPIPVHLQQRYEVVDTFRDAQDRLSYRINVLKRYRDGEPYLMDNVIYVTRTSSGLEYTQRNIKLMKLVFPVENDVSWNGNVFIPMNDADMEEYQNVNWNYTYALKGGEFDPGNNLYENVVHVNQINDSLNNPDIDSTAYAFKNYSKEIYAYGVGMIYRERVYWTFQPSMGSQGGGSGHKKGYGVIMRAIENN